jgi:CRISPR-associated protein Csh1
MLDTLIQIGKTQSAGKEDWDAKIYNPPDKTQLVWLIFDIDNNKIETDPELFDGNKALQYRCLDVLKGRNLNALVTVASEHLPQLKKSLIGGEFLSIIRDKKNKECHYLEHTVLGKALLKIYEMRQVFESYPDTEGRLSNKNNVITVGIKCQELGLSEAKSLSHFNEFEEYAKIKIFKTSSEDNTKKLCYATGEISEDVRALELTERFSLNKMFVTETKNYLTDFSKKNAIGNYQVGKQNQIFLDVGSKFIIDNWRITIAEVNHVILPKLQGENPVWDDILLNKMKTRAELVFKTHPLENLNQDLTYNDEMYWF